MTINLMHAGREDLSVCRTNPSAAQAQMLNGVIVQFMCSFGKHLRVGREGTIIEHAYVILLDNLPKVAPRCPLATVAAFQPRPLP